MTNEKIIKKLEGLAKEIREMKSLHYKKGQKRYNEINLILKRIIDRIYPEKQAKDLKDKLVNKFWILTGNETDKYWQEDYLDKLERAERIIKAILEENELFGFEDFKPIREKTETEFGFGLNKLAFWRRKKVK